MAEITATPIETDLLLANFSAAYSQAGGIASFIGYVRGQAGSVTGLVLEQYQGFTGGVLDQIEASAKVRFDLLETLVIHRVGQMGPGEAIVIVAAVALHRKPAIQAIDYMMDCLKTDAPFWKKELGAQGEIWVEPRQDDYAARQDWDNQI
jgi:molybdopterin synthase catalytic subunit